MPTARFYHPAFRLNRRGNGSRLFVALAMDWFKCDWEEDRESTQINQMVMLGSDGEVVAYHWLEGQYDRLPSLMADLVRRRVAVIATRRSASTCLCNYNSALTR